MSLPQPKTVFRVLFLCFHDMLTYAMLSPILALLFLDGSCCLLAPDNGMKHFIFGLFLSIYSLMQIIALPFWARASLRTTKQNILRLAYLGNSLGYALGAAGVYWHTPVLLFLGFALAGLMGANLPIMQAIISENTPRSQWSRYYSLLGAIIGAAFIIGPQITGWCLHTFTSHEVCLGLYLLCSAVSLLNLALIRFIPPGEQPAGQAEQFPQFQTPTIPNFQTPTIFLFSSEIRRILLLQFCVCMGWYGFIKFFQVYLIETLQCTTVWSCYGMSYLGFCCTLWQGMRFSFNHRFFASRYSFHLALLLMAGSFLSFMVITSIPGVIIAVCCLACSYAMLVPSILALLISKGEISAEFKTTAYQAVQAMAKIFAPLLAGFVLSFTSIATALICAVLILVAGVILLRSPQSFSLEVG